jgi:acyl-coenzyme A thioesterase PaaI-like protein
MTDAAIAVLERDGWTMIDDDGFINLVGPLWRRISGTIPEYAIVGQDKHRNRRGVVQGGLLMTLADRTCGMTARFVSGAETMATVQMDTHFVDAARIGDIMISKPHVVRITKSLVFMSTEITVASRCIATAQGVFKVVRKELTSPGPD